MQRRMKTNTHEKFLEHKKHKRGCGRQESPNHLENRDVSMNIKRLTSNQSMKTQKKERKMSDNVKFSNKQSQKQTRSLWAKRLGNLQAHKQTKTSMTKKTAKSINKREYQSHKTICNLSQILKR